MSKTPSENYEHSSIIVKEAKNGRTVKIACWKCGKTQWVQRGSTCYRTGLCHRCYMQTASTPAKKNLK